VEKRIDRLDPLPTLRVLAELVEKRARFQGVAIHEERPGLVVSVAFEKLILVHPCEIRGGAVASKGSGDGMTRS
jgi:hypothetical protein